MNTVIRFYVVMLCLADISCSGQNEPYYTHKHFGTYYEEFAYQQDLIRFLNVKKHDVIADIGTSDGYIMTALSLLCDSVTFYAEDIDPKELNQKNFHKSINYFTKLRKTPQTNQFHYTIGTYTSTNLPIGKFDKLFLAASFHEFTDMDLMMNDFNEKLKPGGKIYILEAFSLKDKTIYCDDHHKGYRIDEVVDIMSKHGFYLTLMRNPESNIVNYANCLVFEKDPLASETFYSKQKKVQTSIDLTCAFNNKTVACDWSIMERKTDSIKVNVSEISGIYSAYECWVRDIGVKWMKSQEYASAINVFKALCILYPETYLNHLSLANAHEANNQNDLALISYKKVFELGSR